MNAVTCTFYPICRSDRAVAATIGKRKRASVTAAPNSCSQVVGLRQARVSGHAVAEVEGDGRTLSSRRKKP